MDISNDAIENLVESLNKIPGIRVTLEYSKERDQQDKTPLFKDYAQYWLQTYCLGKVKNNTYTGTYQIPVDLHLIPYFGDYHINEIKPNIIQEYFNYKSSISSLESQKKMKSCLRGIFEVALSNDLCKSNPVTSVIKLTSDIPPLIKNVWTQKQYDIAWKFATTHKNGMSVLILMETGISRSELLGLHRTDHDSKNAVLYIRRGRVIEKDPVTGISSIVEDGLKNNYRERAIPLSPELNAAIMLHPKIVNLRIKKGKTSSFRQVKPKHIIYSPNGCGCRPDNWYRRVFVAFMRELNEAHSEVPALLPHELRHTRATLLKNKGVDVYSIARLLGHCDLDMLVKRYAHDDIDALRTALNK